jgi:hypothetical protein
LKIHRYTLRLRKSPWKDLRRSNVFLGAGGGAVGQNSAASPAVLAGEGAGEDLGFVRTDLCVVLGRNGHREWHGGAGRCDRGAPARGGSLGDTDLAQWFQSILEEG